MPNSSISIRFAKPHDVSDIYAMILELAEYENLLHEVTANEKDIEKALFGKRPVAEALMAQYDDQPAGFALYFTNFSTFVGKPGIYLEDLYVKAELRGKGIGKALLIRLAQLAEERRCGRLEWSVLNWNQPSIQFYKSLGAISMDEWTVYRVTSDKFGEIIDSVKQKRE